MLPKTKKLKKGKPQPHYASFGKMILANVTGKFEKTRKEY